MTSPDPREPLGRLVHDIRLAAEADRAAAEGRQRFLLGEWEDRDDGQHELDMRIGTAVAAEARRDVEAELIRLRKFRMAVTVCLPVALDALRVAPDSAEAGFPAWRYVAAREALVSILGPDKSSSEEESA